MNRMKQTAFSMLMDIGFGNWGAAWLRSSTPDTPQELIVLTSTAPLGRTWWMPPPPQSRPPPPRNPPRPPRWPVVAAADSGRLSRCQSENETVGRIKKRGCDWSFAVVFCGGLLCMFIRIHLIHRGRGTRRSGVCWVVLFVFVDALALLKKSRQNICWPNIWNELWATILQHSPGTESNKNWIYSISKLVWVGLNTFYTDMNAFQKV